MTAFCDDMATLQAAYHLGDAMVAKLVIQTVVWIVSMGAVLFLVAGTVHWVGAWVLLVELGVASIVIGLWLARRDPQLLRERMFSVVQSDSRGQVGWDRRLMIGVIVVWSAWIVLMALDAGRFRWSHVPGWLQIVGAVGIAVTYYVCYLVFRENPYATPAVKVQQERGHKAITTGPYRYVRHPMYAGAIPFFVGAPLLLGSWYGLATAPLLFGALVIRIFAEERTLRAQLPGYAEYADRVRYRLIPGVW